MRDSFSRSTYGKQKAAFFSRVRKGGDAFQHSWSVSDKPVHAPLEMVQTDQTLLFQHFHRKQGDQLHEGAYFKGGEMAVWHMNPVIEKAVFRLPEAPDLFSHMVNSVGDPHEMLEEFSGNVFIGRVGAGQIQGDGQHIQGVHGHPGRSIGLFQMTSSREGRASVKNADVVQSQKAPLKDVATFVVLAVDPPGEIQQQLVEQALQEKSIGLAGDLLGGLVYLEGSPSVDWWVHIAEVPFVGRYLSIGVL